MTMMIIMTIAATRPLVFILATLVKMLRVKTSSDLSNLGWKVETVHYCSFCRKVLKTLNSWYTVHFGRHDYHYCSMNCMKTIRLY